MVGVKAGVPKVPVPATAAKMRVNLFTVMYKRTRNAILVCVVRNYPDVATDQGISANEDWEEARVAGLMAVVALLSFDGTNCAGPLFSVWQPLT